jgi:glycosyltransferase involved in cell wall biosynthesis
LSPLRLKILMLVFNQTGKGTYWRAYHFARILAARHHSVTLISTSKHARHGVTYQEIDGIHLLETPDVFTGSLRSGYDPWNVINRLSQLRNKRFNIVHAFESRPVVIYPALDARKRGAVMVLDWADWFGRGGSVEERKNPIVRSALRIVETYYEDHFRRHASGTTVINNFLKERALSLGVKPGTILLLRNGSDTRSAVIERMEARNLSGIRDDGPLIGFVGGTYANDAQLMAQAFNRVLNRFPTARLVLAGYFNRDIEAELANPGAIIRTGPITSQQVHMYLSACDLCWLPLTASGANLGRWPFKLNDYMTAGRATISTDIGDLKEVIPLYKLGVVTKPDPASFASGTLELLDSPGEASALGNSARAAAEQHFEWENITLELEDFYLRLLSNQPH